MNIYGFLRRGGEHVVARDFLRANQFGFAGMIGMESYDVRFVDISGESPHVVMIGRKDKPIPIAPKEPVNKTECRMQIGFNMQMVNDLCGRDPKNSMRSLWDIMVRSLRLWRTTSVAMDAGVTIPMRALSYAMPCVYKRAHEGVKANGLRPPSSIRLYYDAVFVAQIVSDLVVKSHESGQDISPEEVRDIIFKTDCNNWESIFAEMAGLWNGGDSQPNVGQT